MFDFEELVRSRCSSRRFLPTSIPRELLAEALRGEVEANPRELAPLPAASQVYRRELGAIVYGAMGISRDDEAGRALASQRNYEFFGAPMAGILCMHRDLGLADAVSVGMYLQTLVLGLTARGIGTCVQAALTTYPEVIRRELAIPEELVILCGLSLGYADPAFPANHLKVPKKPVEQNVSILGPDVDRAA